MSLTCPKCSEEKIYIKDVNGEMITGSLSLVLTYKCTNCKHQWNIEKEAYVNQSKIV